jgi:hypothetical protein
MPDVQAAIDGFERRNRNELALLRETYGPEIVTIILALRRNLQAIRGNPRNSVQAMVDDTNAARAAAAKALDKSEAGVRQAVGNVRDDIAQQTTVKLDGQAAILRELQLQSAQRRVDLMNRAGVAPATMIARLSAQGDLLALQVMRQEMPIVAGEDAQNQRQLEGLMVILDLAETPLQSATQQASRLLEAELSVGLANLTGAYAVARAEAPGASQSSSSGYPVGQRGIIPGWARGSVLNLAETQPDGGNTSVDTPLASGTTGYTQHPGPSYGKLNADGQ